MADKQFDPEKFIDRDFEQDLFEDLLQFKDQARILAIEDKGGMGKSQLLQKFQYRCRAVRHARIPVSLVDLAQLPDRSPLSLVQHIEKDLSAFYLEFPTFARLEAARRSHDFTTIRGTVDLRSANLSQAQVKTAGVIIEQAGPVTMSPTTVTFTPEQQAMAQELCVQAFLTDLLNHCNQQLVVIILDAYEECIQKAEALHAWLLERVLEPYCFDVAKRPTQLVVVIAGREIPRFHQRWLREECKSIVKSVHALGKWQPAHVEECLHVHGFRYNEQQLKFFCDMIEMGYAPSYVVEAMEIMFNQRGR